MRAFHVKNGFKMPPSLTIGSTTSSQGVATNLRQASHQSQSSVSRLSSGLRLNSSSDNASDLAVATAIRADLRGYQQASRNINDATSLMQTAESAAGQIVDVVLRMRELAVQSASDGITDKERDYMQLEHTDLSREIDRMSRVTEFNGQTLLDGTGGDGLGGFVFQVDTHGDSDNRLKTKLQRLDSFSVFGGISFVASQVAAQKAITQSDDALGRLAKSRTSMGSFINKLENAATYTATMNENLNVGESQLRDVDVAQESAEFSRSQVLQNAGVAMMAQANSNQSVALRLIG